MNEQLQSKLVEILTGIQGAVKAGADFTLQQLPDIAQQYVTYGRVMNTASVALGIAMAAALFYVALRFYKEARAAEDFHEFAPSLLCALAGFGAIFASIVTLANLNGMFLVWFAPKVWLLKELAALVK